MTYDLDLIIEEDNIDLDLDFKEDVSILKGDPGKDGVNGRDGCSVCYVDISWPIYRSGEPLSGYNMDKSLFDPSTKIDDFGISSNGIFFKIISFDELDNSYFCNYKTTLKGGKGDKGDKGDAGVIRFIPVNVLPTEDIDASAIYLLPIADSTEEENRFTEHVYINGKWEQIGSISVQVDHSEYVKFTDYATVSKAGVVVAKPANGIQCESGDLKIIFADDSDIEEKTSKRKPIVPSKLDYALKVGITTNTETLTDEEKASACDWLGAVAKPTDKSGYIRVYGVTASNNNPLMLSVQLPSYDFTEVGKNNRSGLPRYEKGNLGCAIPLEDYHTANKKYVDDNIGERVKKTDYVSGNCFNDASALKDGIVKLIPYGHGGIDVSVSKNGLRTIKASRTLIDKRTSSDYFDGGTATDNDCNVISPANIDYAVMSALSDSKDLELWSDDTTDENGDTVHGTKSKARELLGAVGSDDLNKCVKFTDVASADKFGVVRRTYGAAGGIDICSVSPEIGAMIISRALNKVIDARTPNDYKDTGTQDPNRCQPICPANLDYAVMSALANSKDADGTIWTEERKQAARDFLGVTPLIEALTSEIASLRAEIELLKTNNT